MNTVFSHIVQKRLSQENENVATEALAFILDSSDAARIGLMNILRGIAPDLPNLHFRTQQTQGDARPDMWGYDVVTPRALLENKFWAGLTDTQPVGYLKVLASSPQPTILLMVVPEARQETIWRELNHRLDEAGLYTPNRETPTGVYRAVQTVAGPILALTSWPMLLSSMGAELVDEPRSMNDLIQLQALCDAADRDAFLPLSSAELTDQRLPAYVLRLNTIVQSAVQLGITEGVLSTKGLKPTSTWEHIGQYIEFPSARKVGAWIGTSFRLWRQYGGTPLWLRFPIGKWGRAIEVQAVLRPWAYDRGVAAALDSGWFVVGITLITGEEKEAVVRGVVDQVRLIAGQLSSLTQREDAAK